MACIKKRNMNRACADNHAKAGTYTEHVQTVMLRQEHTERVSAPSTSDKTHFSSCTRSGLMTQYDCIVL